MSWSRSGFASTKPTVEAARVLVVAFLHECGRALTVGDCRLFALAGQTTLRVVTSWSRTNDSLIKSSALPIELW